MSKRFQKTRIVDKWGGIYDSKTDRVLSVNDVEHKLNEQQATIQSLKEENEQLRQIATRTEEEKEEYADLYNEYRKENEQLRQQLQKKNEEEQLYANEIVKLNKEVKDNQFLQLGNDY